jgi:hypothetical protein
VRVVSIVIGNRMLVIRHEDSGGSCVAEGILFENGASQAGTVR